MSRFSFTYEQPGGGRIELSQADDGRIRLAVRTKKIPAEERDGPTGYIILPEEEAKKILAEVVTAATPKEEPTSG